MQVPSEGNHGSWRTFCFGDEAADVPPHQPTMPVLMAIDQVTKKKKKKSQPADVAIFVGMTAACVKRQCIK